jgi:hypothetical protein
MCGDSEQAPGEKNSFMTDPPLSGRYRPFCATLQSCRS